MRLFAAAASLKLTFWTKRGGSCKPCHFPRHWLHGSFWLSQVVHRFPLMHYLITYQVLPGDPGKDKFSPGKFLFILHAEHFWVCTTFIHETLVSQVEHLCPKKSKLKTKNFFSQQQKETRRRTNSKKLFPGTSGWAQHSSTNIFWVAFSDTQGSAPFQKKAFPRMGTKILFVCLFWQQICKHWLPMAMHLLQFKFCYLLRSFPDHGHGCTSLFSDKKKRGARHPGLPMVLWHRNLQNALPVPWSQGVSPNFLVSFSQS